jgi:GGDEF domain-containing protein
LGGSDPVGAFANKRCLAMTKALRQNQKDHFEFELTFFAGKTYLLYSCLLGYVQDRKTFVIALKRLRILESFVTGLVQKASIDTTTGLENKDVCLREINALPLDDKSFVIFMDLNNFKLVNDVYGHTVGDIILKRFSDVLKKDRFQII